MQTIRRREPAHGEPVEPAQGEPARGGPAIAPV